MSFEDGIETKMQRVAILLTCPIVSVKIEFLFVFSFVDKYSSNANERFADAKLVILQQQVAFIYKHEFPTKCLIIRRTSLISNNMFYRVCHGFRITKQEDYF